MKLKAFSVLTGTALATAALATGPFATGAYADVKYTETMTMSGKGAGGPPSRTTTYIKAGLERSEQTLNMGPITMKMITVNSCPLKRTMRFDPALKIYTSSPLYGQADASKDDARANETKADPQPRSSGKITMTSDVKSLGIEEVAGRKARHYIIDQKMQPEGCAGKQATSFKSEIWVADYDMPAFACRNPWMAAASAPTTAAGGCSISYESKGDQAALAAAYRGLIVKRKMVMGETVMTWQLTELSEAKLDDALFAPDAGWKLVSDAEFDKQRQAEMMKGMMSGGAAGNGGDEDEKEPAGAPAEEKDPEAPAAEEKPAEPAPKEKKRKFPKLKLPF